MSSDALFCVTCGSSVQDKKRNERWHKRVTERERETEKRREEKRDNNGLSESSKEGQGRSVVLH